MKSIIRLFMISIIWLLFFSISKADFDLTISAINLSDWWNTVSLFAEPSINITIENIWSDIAQNSSEIPEWFISCIETQSNNEVFRSSKMNTFIVNPSTSIIAWNLKLKSTLTQTQRTVEIECVVNKKWWYNSSFTSSGTNTNNNSLKFSFWVDKIWRFDSSMNRAIDPIRWNLDASEPNSLIWWWDSIRSFVFTKIVNVIIPIIIIVGIAIWIIGIYKLFFSSNEDDTKKWIQLIIYWILWIVIILSARYIWSVIFEDMLQSWDAVWINGVDLANQLYNKIAYPFIKIVIYLVLGVLFLVLSGKVFSLMSKSDWSSQKQATTMIARSAISMLIIIWSKQIVEAIYWKQSEVLNESAQNIWEIWSWLLADKSIPILYTVINRIMWLTSLIVLIIIIFQTFQILTNPEKAENRQKIWKSILYIFIGILVIGAWYIIANFLVIN